MVPFKNVLLYQTKQRQFKFLIHHMQKYINLWDYYIVRYNTNVLLFSCYFITGTSLSTIFKIPLSYLAGHINSDRLNQRKQSSSNLLAPITNGERPGINKRSPLVRTKGGLAPPVFVEQVNRYFKKSICKILFSKFCNFGVIYVCQRKAWKYQRGSQRSYRSSECNGEREKYKQWFAGQN